MNMGLDPGLKSDFQSFGDSRSGSGSNKKWNHNTSNSNPGEKLRKDSALLSCILKPNQILCKHPVAILEGSVAGPDVARVLQWLGLRGQRREVGQRRCRRWRS